MHLVVSDIYNNVEYYNTKIYGLIQFYYCDRCAKMIMVEPQVAMLPLGHHFLSRDLIVHCRVLILSILMKYVSPLLTIFDNHNISIIRFNSFLKFNINGLKVQKC